MIASSAQHQPEQNAAFAQYATSSKVINTEEPLDERHQLMLDGNSIESQEYHSNSIRERPQGNENANWGTQKLPSLGAKAQ